MGEIWVAFISVSGTVIISLISVFVAKKYNIGPNQEKLVQTLKDIVSAQDRKISELQQAVEKGQRQIDALTLQLNELRELTVNQALLIDDLQSQLIGKNRVG